MANKKIRWLIISISGFFLILDQVLKWIAVHNLVEPEYFNNFLGWHPFLNRGIAFSLPLSNTLTVILTIPMIFLIGILAAREYNRNNVRQFLGWSLILSGSVSNLLDRMIYKSVVDYFLILTAIINISDLLIITGLGLFLLNLQKRRIF